MDDFITDLMATLVNHGDVKEMFRQVLENAVNQLLEHELTVFLDYEKWDVVAKKTDDCRNGYYERTFQTTYGPLHLKVPRDRYGEFEQHTLPSRVRSSDDLEQFIMCLYKNGVTTREISSMIDQMYGNYYSAASVSRLSKMVDEDVKAFHERKIRKDYVVLYCDATFVSVRRDTVAKEGLHVITGVDREGHKEVLDFMLFPHESAENYREMLLSLQQRGLENVLLIVSDGLVGLADAVTDVFPKAQHQSCWTHLQRNADRRVRSKDKKEVAEDLKHVYHADTEQEGLDRLDEFCSKWERRYPRLVTLFKNRKSLFSYLKFPRAIRKSLYTNNLAESLNKGLKRGIKVKEQFPTVDSLERYACSYYMDYNEKREARRQPGYKEVSYELSKMFEEIA